MLLRRLRTDVHTAMERIDGSLLRADKEALQTYRFQYERLKVLVVRNRYTKALSSSMSDHPTVVLDVVKSDAGRHRDGHVMPDLPATPPASLLRIKFA